MPLGPLNVVFAGIDSNLRLILRVTALKIGLGSVRVSMVALSWVRKVGQDDLSWVNNSSPFHDIAGQSSLFIIV